MTTRKTSRLRIPYGILVAQKDLFEKDLKRVSGLLREGSVLLNMKYYQGKLDGLEVGLRRISYTLTKFVEIIEELENAPE